MNKLVILTGPSGSGLSTSKFVFEEMGFLIVENPPKESIEKVLESFLLRSKKIHNFCLILNISEARESIRIIRKNEKFSTKIILLLADKEELLKRYALSRHAHVRSVMENLSLEAAIDKDIVDANQLIEYADAVLDTSSISIKSLRRFVYDSIERHKKGKEMNVNFISFGFKNGTPEGLDLVFDVRSIPNPFWVDELKELTGYDEKVVEFMEKYPQTKTLLNRITTFLASQLSEVQEGGRANYNIGIACSGGQHRSTYVARYLKNYFADSYSTNVIHRDTPYLNDRD